MGFNDWKLSGKLVLPVLIGGVIIVAVVLVAMLFIRDQNTELAGLNTAESVANQIVTVRTFYTAEVVPRAKRAGMGVNYDFADHNDVIPLPATLTRVLGEQIAEAYPGMLVRLYSRFPFPHRSSLEKYDDFELEAITALEKDSNTPFYRLENVNGRLSMRYAIADVMRPGCIGCHNSHPESPKTDWQVGDVRGVVEVIVPVDAVEAGLNSGTVALGTGVVVGFAALIIIILLMFRRIVIGPVRQVTGMMKDVAQGEGDLTKRIVVKSKDEVGELGSWSNQFIENLGGIIRRVVTTSDQVASSASQISESSSQVSKGAELQASAVEDASSSISEMSVSIASVANDAQSLSSSVTQTTSSIEEMMASISEVSSSTDSLASSVSQTSSSIEEMAVSVEQVAKNIKEVSQAASEAVTEANGGREAVEQVIEGMKDVTERMDDLALVIGKLDQSSREIGTIIEVIDDIAEQTNLLALNAAIESARKLDQSSREIGTIIEVIDDIAEQTNLLALNAAIESARAGEAGRGFAVVADEVRKLAERSSKATKEIANLIKGIQAETTNAVESANSSRELVQKGAELSDKAGDSLKTISENAVRSAKLMDEMSKATEEQSETSKQIVKSSEEMNSLTQQIANALREQAVGSEEINKAVLEMSKMTDQVSHATKEQQSTGEQVVKATETINDASDDNKKAMAEMAKSAEDMSEQAEGLKSLLSSFRIDGDKEMMLIEEEEEVT